MKVLDAFGKGDGAHWGLSDWYERGEAQLTVALADHVPFDTGTYSSKKEIAYARIWSEDGAKIKIEVTVFDDFDTEGIGYASTTNWTLDALKEVISRAWNHAEVVRNENQEYEGFRAGREGRWEETYLVNIGYSEARFPSGDNYHWWGWQHDETEDNEGIPNPDIPVETVQAFKKWANDYSFGRTREKSLKIGQWEIKPWRDQYLKYERY